MFRGAAAAGLSITLGLVAASAFAGPATAAVTAGHPSGGHSTSHGSGGTGGGTGGGAAPSNGPLPTVTSSQCQPSPTYRVPPGIPWAQQALDYQSVWRFSKGAGVKVAVIDSGVDANPQLNGRVSVGQTFTSAQSGPADGDCEGHGTMVAGIIGAAPVPGTAFAGVAPQAQIVSYKVSGQTVGDKNLSVSTLVLAIAKAIQDRAKIINLSVSTASNDPALQTVVEYAVHHNIVVVAAAGNDQMDLSTGQLQHGPYYPAQYPGVLSVGAVDQNGSLASFADRQTNVSVTAPGSNITSTFPGTNGDAYGAADGTSFAAPFVSGLAALVWSRYPTLTAQQVVRRIVETADGSAGTATGNGLINPVQAITAVVPPEAAPTQAARPAAVTVDRASSNFSEKVVALSLAGGAFVLAVVVIAAAVVIPAGRRRRWRPGAP